MKTKVVTLLTALLLFASFATPALAASSSYSFTMQYRVVDGDRNGNHFKLDSGGARISGRTSAVRREQGAVGPYSVNYTLHRRQFGANPSFGNVNGGINRSFSGNFNNVTESSNYYLFIWKTNEDGYTVTGNGTVSNR